MKKNIIIILLIISYNTYSQKNAVISGEIKNTTNDNISIIINGGYPGANLQSYNSKVDSKGKFRIIIPLSKSSVAFLKTSKANIGLFMTPNDSIYCTYNDSNVLESIKFEGNNSNQYNYFVEYQNEFGNPHGTLFETDYSDVFNMSAIQFKKHRQEKVEKDLLFLKEYSKKSCTNRRV